MSRRMTRKMARSNPKSAAPGPQRAGAPSPHEEAPYRFMFENHPHPMFVYDLGTLAFLAVNDAMMRHYGYSREDLLAMTVKDIRPPEDIPALLKDIAGITGHDLRRLRRHRKKDGAVFYVDMVARSVTFQGRRARLVLAHDVTERVQAEQALRKSEQRFRLLAENAQDVIYRYRLAPSRLYEYISPAVTAITGYTPEEHYADPDLGFRIVHPEDRPLLETMLASPEAHRGPLVLRWWHKDGRLIWTEHRNVPIHDETGTLVAVEGISRDITERKRAEEIRARLIAILEETTDFVGIIKASGRVLYRNRALRALLGIAGDNDPSRRTIVADHPEWARALMFDEGIPFAVQHGSWSGEVALLRHDGQEIPVSQVILAHRTPEGGVEFLSTIARDITERKRLERELEYLADHDSLTGLFNRRRFLEEMEFQMAQARRYGTCGALLFLDLDQFKEVNDRLGHPVGDKLLASLAVVLRNRLRETDILARLGGDEFAVLLPLVDAGRAEAVARHLLGVLRGHRVVIDGHAITITTSIGIALFPDHGSTTDALLAHADVAMYMAKESGRDRAAMYRPEMGRQTPASSRLSQEPVSE